MRPRVTDSAASVRRHRAEPPLEWPDPAVPIDRQAMDELFSAAYEELRRLASSVRRQERNVSLSPTALVNEAWLRLAKSPPFRATSPLHFKRIAARAMRQILIEAARRRHANKRGGHGACFVTFDEAIDQVASTVPELIALDQALTDLARLHPRQAMLVESRYFGGLDVTETATLLGISEATALRDWRAAKAWLAAEIERSRPER